MKIATVSLLHLYQALLIFKRNILISVFGYHSVCKHKPSCSQYTINQVENNGTISGLWNGFVRIISCW